MAENGDVAGNSSWEPWGSVRSGWAAFWPMTRPTRGRARLRVNFSADRSGHLLMARPDAGRPSPRASASTRKRSVELSSSRSVSSSDRWQIGKCSEEQIVGELQTDYRPKRAAAPAAYERRSQRLGPSPGAGRRSVVRLPERTILPATCSKRWRTRFGSTRASSPSGRAGRFTQDRPIRLPIVCQRSPPSVPATLHLRSAMPVLH